MRRLALFVVFFCSLLLASHAQRVLGENERSEEKVLRGEEVSDQPLFRDEAEMRALNFMGTLPQQVVQDFDVRKAGECSAIFSGFFFFSLTRSAAVTVVDDSQEGDVMRPQRVEEVEALLNKEIVFDEAALVRAENKTTVATMKPRLCVEKTREFKAKARQIKNHLKHRKCILNARRGAYVALGKFAKIPQPVSRIVARLDAPPSSADQLEEETRKVVLRFALFRQAKRELARITVLKGPTCADSFACAFAFDETAKARKAALERVYGSVLAPQHQCMLREGRGNLCVNRMLRAFEALPVKTRAGVVKIIDAESGAKDKLPPAKERELTKKLETLRQEFVACGIMRHCKFAKQLKGVVRLFGLVVISF